VAGRWKNWIAPMALCAAIVLGGCKQITGAKGEGDKLAAGVHSAMSRGDWKGLYDSADPDLRAGTPKDKFGALFTRIANKLGSPVSFKETGWNLDKSSDGTFLKATCDTKFSNNASGTETIEWRKVDGKYLLYSYHIKSDALPTQ